MSDYVESWQQSVLDNAPNDETPDDVLRLIEGERYLNRGSWAAYVVRLGAANLRRIRREMIENDPIAQLRRALNERGIEWHDDSELRIMPGGSAYNRYVYAMVRTKWEKDDEEVSVIWGYTQYEKWLSGEKFRNGMSYGWPDLLECWYWPYRREPFPATVEEILEVCA